MIPLEDATLCLAVLSAGMLALRWARGVYLTGLAQRHLEECERCRREFWQPFLRCGVIVSELWAVRSGCPEWPLLSGEVTQ